MWSIFKYRQSNLQQNKESAEEEVQKLKQLRGKFDSKMKKLAMQIKDSQDIFIRIYQVNAKDEALSNTFLEMMTTLEGLVSIIEQLKKQYEESHQQLIEFEKVKQMLSNHHTIVNSIQDSYNDQIKHLYEQKNKALEELQKRISLLLKDKQQLTSIVDDKQRIIKSYQSEIDALQTQNKDLRNQNTKILQQKESIQEKYSRFVQGNNNIQNKKMINFDCIRLQYIFYYVRLREKIMSFLDIKDFISLKATNKIYRHTLEKESSKYVFSTMRNKHRRNQQQQLKHIKYYEKIYQLFPNQNIKINAFKYLYFKIKPASYILSYLQEDPEIQASKIEIEPKDKTKFNWRQIFSSDKNRKEDGQKFTIAQLKNQEEYKKIESKIESTFRNILSIHMPQDLRYFSQTMEKQLQQLKSNLILSKHKTSQTQWTAQLHCLSKFMYLQINQLYNLLHVIFGELITKNKDLINLSQGYQYLRQNQGVLRTLIETISHDKSALQKKCVLMQNDVVKMNLEREVIVNKYELMFSNYQQMVQKYEAVNQECTEIKKSLQRYQQDKRFYELSFQKIREELQILETVPVKSRKNSMASSVSEQQKLQ